MTLGGVSWDGNITQASWWANEAEFLRGRIRVLNSWFGAVHAELG
jgi:hypothetical protein